MKRTIQPLSDNNNPDIPINQPVNPQGAVVGNTNEPVAQAPQPVISASVPATPPLPFTQAQTQPQNPQTSSNYPVGLSASQLGLGAPSSVVNWVNLAKRGAFVVVVLLILGLGWFFFENSRNKTSPLSPYTVSQSIPHYSVNFYPGATVEQKSGRTYLVSKDSHGTQSSVWVMSVNSSVSCNTKPTFSFTSPSGNQEKGCYRSDRIIYAADVQVNRQYYQLNLASQKPISGNDARAIFGSINIR